MPPPFHHATDSPPPSAAYASMIDACQALPPTDTLHVAGTFPSVTAFIPILSHLPYAVLHVYTPYPKVVEQLSTLTVPGKTLVPHLIEAIYPEQWLFTLSRHIAETRLQEILRYSPHLLTLRSKPDLDFKPLAIRRLSLGHLYFELSILFALMQERPATPEPVARLFLSHLFGPDDLTNATPLPADLPLPDPAHTCIWPVAQIFGNRDKPNALEKWLVRYCTGTTQHTFADLTRHLKNTPPGHRRTLLNVYIRYRQHPALQFTRWVEVNLRHTRKKFSSLQSLLHYLHYQYRLLRGITSHQAAMPSTVVAVASSITPQNLNYYLRLFTPILGHISQPFQLLLSQQPLQRKSATLFTQQIQMTLNRKKNRKHLLPSIYLPRLPKFHFYYRSLFHAYATPQDAFTISNSSFPAQTLLCNTIEHISNLQVAIGQWHYVLIHRPVRLLIGLEEEIETLSICNLLKPLMPYPYTTFVIPSCLPEYSECYDCVDVDHLCVALPFVREIFEEQRLNAKHIHVVGSQEWEEPYDTRATFPPDAEALIARSSFTLGVLHQPIFVTMHGQSLYNNLTVNFLDIYQRFLDAHPTACIVIKPHPRDDLDALRAYLPPSERIVILPKETPNRLLYQRIDAALSIHSTMVIHALAHGVPVVSMYKYPDYQPLYRFIDHTGSLATDCHDEALTWLGRMQNEPAFRDAVTQRMQALRADVLDTPASKRIQAILQQEALI